MKILWLTNVPLPPIAHDIGMDGPVLGGWLTGYAESLVKTPNTELVVVCPARVRAQGTVQGITYYTYTGSVQSQMHRRFNEILKEQLPNVVHIFGTELSHSAVMMDTVQELGLLDQTVISVQGMTGIIARHYKAFLPNRIAYRKSLRDILKRTSVASAAKAFARSGEIEIRALKLARHVIGRTDWDEACVKAINPKIQYHFCNESLRESFYEHTWSLQDCRRHSLFVSQCSYPVKGFHLMLEAMGMIIKKYPDAHLYTTGRPPFGNTLKEKLKRSGYEQYLGQLIKRYGLKDNVTFLGTLDEASMCRQYLQTHVFVSPSSIENSPNSVGEAMILGVPVVSSDVGGVKNLLTHGYEGFVYPADEPYMIAYYAEKIFEDDELALKLSENARAHAKLTHNRELNANTLVNIYRSML